MNLDRKLNESLVGLSSSITKTVSESDVYLFAGITGDFSPNHIDEVFMSTSIYKKRIAHGALLVGFMSAATARCNIGRTVSLGYNKIRFILPVFLGDTITTEYKISRIEKGKNRIFADLRCKNQSGTIVAVGEHVRAYVG